MVDYSILGVHLLYHFERSDNYIYVMLMTLIKLAQIYQ